jgi:hypothetical protein
MVTSASLFNQLLKHFPRTEFALLVKKHGAERGAKGFDCWTQFVAMLFCQLARTESLREICNGMYSCLGKLPHLGVRRAPVRSTLAYANQHRPAALFEDLFWTALGRFRNQQLLGGRPKTFRFKNKLITLDSTTISLCLSLFPWARFKTTKGGVKAHVLLDHDDYMPRFVSLTNANVADVRMARSMPLPPQSIVTCDRAYLHFATLRLWNQRRVFFVCRAPSGPLYEVLENRPVVGSVVLEDQTVQFTGRYSGVYTQPLRRIVLAGDKEPVVVITNIFHFAATTIAKIYEERWKIEVFFKTLKQNLKIKTFVGTSENALRIQIWTALLALLLLKWLHHLSKAKWSLSNLASLLRLNLFTYRDLLAWLHDPAGTPPLEPQPVQPLLSDWDLGHPLKI